MADSEEEARAQGLISQLIDGMDPGTFVTKFVVIAEGIDSNGDRAVYSAAHSGASAWDILGLLSYGLARENGALAKGSDYDN